MSCLGQEVRHGGGLLQTFLQQLRERLPGRVVRLADFPLPYWVKEKVRMLVFTGNVGETIHVGNQIGITVLDIQGDDVRLGIVVPEGVNVDRQEVHAKRKNQWASITSSLASRLGE